MAVTYANTLSGHIAFSGLIATRKEGLLKEQLNSEVHYSFLNKKGHFDINALLKLRHFCKKNKIEYIHAHSSSFFWAVLIKMTLPKIKLIWHDHYGDRAKQSKANFILKEFSRFFYLIIAVNEELRTWSLSQLKAKRVVYLPNFSVENGSFIKYQTILKGEEGKKIVFLANLKQPKNHITFLRAFFNSSIHKEGWTVHLIGKIFNDNYSQEILDFINKNNLQETVYLYGSCNDIQNILKQSTVGVLSSTYEGFPVTLLEYGICGLPVLSTNVGYCSNLIENGKTGLLFNPLQEEEIKDILCKLAKPEELEKIKELGVNLKNKIKQNYSAESVISNYIQLLN
jgi:glycosyltransferase involved in cell wall biosynthesis